MEHVTFILDLTAGTRGADRTVAACQNLASSSWDLCLAWADAGGREAAERLAAGNERCQTIQAGSGTGVCAWAHLVTEARGPWVVFLRPGDRLRTDALAVWRQAIESHDAAQWAVAAVEGAPYAEWWIQGDLRESAAALLAIGATFPDCAAIVHRSAWQAAVTLAPETAADGTRVSAWLALAVAAPPVRTPDVVAVAETTPYQLSADRLVDVLVGLARRDAATLGRVVADITRIGAGLRIAHDQLVETIESTPLRLGALPPPRTSPAAWQRRGRFFDALLARGDRSIWIWGAGQLGREALAWLGARRIPVEGFLDSQASRDGEIWAGAVVRHAAGVCRGDRASTLVVIASMHHDAIAASLRDAGWRDGQDFVVFDRPERTVFGEEVQAA